MFAPDASGWGRLGNTVIRLEVADEATVQVAVAAAWSNVTGVGHAFEVVDPIGNANGPVKVDEVANEVSATAFFNATGAVEAGDDVESRDPLLGVIERLETFWGDGDPSRVSKRRHASVECI